MAAVRTNEEALEKVEDSEPNSRALAQVVPRQADVQVMAAMRTTMGEEPTGIGAVTKPRLATDDPQDAPAMVGLPAGRKLGNKPLPPANSLGYGRVSTQRDRAGRSRSPCCDAEHNAPPSEPLAAMRTR